MRVFPTVWRRGADGRRQRPGQRATTALTANETRQMEAECLAQLARINMQSPFVVEDFLGYVGYLAGGPVYTDVMPPEYAELLAQRWGGHTSACTVSWRDGYGILVNPFVTCPPSTRYGHEAGHILFGDVACGTGKPPSAGGPPLRVELPPANSPEAEELLNTGCPRSLFDTPAESRAERMGALLTAQLEGRGPLSHSTSSALSQLFQAGDV